MPKPSDNVDPGLDDSASLEQLAQKSKTRRQRLDVAKASVDDLLERFGERVTPVADKGSAMFDTAPDGSSTPNAIRSDQPGFQIPDFQASTGRGSAANVPARKRKFRLRNLFGRRRRKFFF